jgi:hypothetical protein
MSRLKIDFYQIIWKGIQNCAGWISKVLLENGDKK